MNFSSCIDGVADLLACQTYLSSCITRAEDLLACQTNLSFFIAGATDLLTNQVRFVNLFLCVAGVVGLWSVKYISMIKRPITLELSVLASDFDKYFETLS